MPSPPDVVIRDATPAEIDDVARLLTVAYAEYVPAAATSRESHEAWAAYAADVADVRSRFEATQLIVAERAGRIVGAVTYYAPGADKTDSGWPLEWAAIRLLGVLPDSRGAGIGRALTEECIRRAREARAPAVGLHTTRLMWIARDMYERMGFVRVPENDFRPAPDILVTGYRLDLDATSVDPTSSSAKNRPAYG